MIQHTGPRRFFAFWSICTVAAVFVAASVTVLPAQSQQIAAPAAAASAGNNTLRVQTAEEIAPAAATALPTPPPPRLNAAPSPEPASLSPAGSIIRRVRETNERLEITVNTSRILELGQRIPQAQVGNPDILSLVPLSPNQVQVSAKKPGVTQVNLWGEDRRIFTLDVIVLGDARELNMILKTQFPKTALTVAPVGSSVLISGYVDQQDNVSRIMQIAEQYYSKVINNMTVSGVQQVLLHVKVMEVSRTKLRRLGFDWSQITHGNLVSSGVNGLLTGVASFQGGVDTVTTGSPATKLAVYGNNSAFFAVLDALRQDSLAKINSEPTLITVSGRPAYFLAGGQIGYVLNGGISGPSTGFVQYGTRVDMVPIVLGNGRIRLEVRPSVSEIDPTYTVPGGPPATKNREVETGVEMRAGQTLAIAGLVQQRMDASNSGLPWLSEVPYMGALFRNVHEQINEVELLILVTPEFADAMDANQVPPCGPGTSTSSPTDWELFMKGYLEVPNCCPTAGAGGCPAGGPGGQCNPHSRLNPTTPAAPGRSDSAQSEPPFIGPVGYDL
jgi:pilus assembly protein CpaC